MPVQTKWPNKRPRHRPLPDPTSSASTSSTSLAPPPAESVRSACSNLNLSNHYELATLIAIADRHSRGIAAPHRFRTRRFACEASSHFAADSRFAKVLAEQLNEDSFVAFIFGSKSLAFRERARSVVDGTMDAQYFCERDFTHPSDRGS